MIRNIGSPEDPHIDAFSSEQTGTYEDILNSPSTYLPDEQESWISQDKILTPDEEDHEDIPLDTDSTPVDDTPPASNTSISKTLIPLDDPPLRGSQRLRNYHDSQDSPFLSQLVDDNIHDFIQDERETVNHMFSTQEHNIDVDQ